MSGHVFGSAAHWAARVAGAAAGFGDAARGHGYPVADDLRIIAEEGCAYCYYDPQRGLIAMGIPDATTRVGRFHWLGYLRLLGVTTIDAAAEEIDHLLDYVVVHELAHHLRHRNGRMLDDHWEEEHAVNILTVAYLRTRDDWAAHRDNLLSRLARMRTGLDGMRSWPLVEATHDDLEEVLFHHLDAIAAADYHDAFAEAARRGVGVMTVIEERGLVSAEQIAEALAEQAEARRRYNLEYMKDITTYWLLCVAQMQVELVDPDLPGFADALPSLLGPATPP